MRASFSRMAAAVAVAIPLAVSPLFASAQQVSGPVGTPAFCGGAGTVTLTGPVPRWNTGTNAHIRIGTRGQATNDIMSDARARIGQMATMSNALGSATQYANALQTVQFTPPQNVNSAASLQQYQTAIAQQSQTLVTEQQSLQTVGVDPLSGAFTCAKIAPGTYTMVADVMNNVTSHTTDQQHFWGSVVPNEHIYAYSFTIPAPSGQQPPQLQTVTVSAAHWQMIATYGQFR